jgi:hypothetical protein
MRTTDNAQMGQTTFNLPIQPAVAIPSRLFYAAIPDLIFGNVPG